MLEPVQARSREHELAHIVLQRADLLPAYLRRVFAGEIVPSHENQQ
jgi:hypothetical protein